MLSLLHAGIRVNLYKKSGPWGRTGSVPQLARGDLNIHVIFFSQRKTIWNASTCGQPQAHICLGICRIFEQPGHCKKLLNGFYPGLTNVFFSLQSYKGTQSKTTVCSSLKHYFSNVKAISHTFIGQQNDIFIVLRLLLFSPSDHQLSMSKLNLHIHICKLIANWPYLSNVQQKPRERAFWTV